jgi:hypothetical protein
MEEKGLLDLVGGGTNVLQSVKRCNSYFSAARQFNPVFMLFAAASWLLVMIAERQAGIYRILSSQRASTEIENWSAQAYASWWASFDAAPAGWITYWCIGTLGVYYILLQQVYGGRIVVFLWRTRNDIKYLADPENWDGSYGWREARNVLYATYASFVIHGIALSILGLALPRWSMWFVAPLLGLWALTLPFYIGIPIFLLRRNIKKFQKEEEERLQIQYETAAELTMKEYICGRLERVRKIRVIPFTTWLGRALAILGTLASLIAVGQLLIAMYG